LRLTDGFKNPRLILPGILAVEAPAYDKSQPPTALESAIRNPQSEIPTLRLILLVDNSAFASESLRNFLWTTFTRTNPATDIHGVDSFTKNKHWGCRGPLIFDARLKPHHAPPRVEDPAITRRVDALAAPGGPLHGII
jgi:4-hydroxy-3-polyprenylbenzoate decarboxylase